MLQDSQTRVLKDIQNGVPSYTTQAKINRSKIVIPSDNIEVELADKASVVKLKGASLPTGSVNVGGDWYVTGNIVASSIAEDKIGVASTGSIQVGGKIGNLGKVFISTSDDAVDNLDDVLVYERDKDGVVIGRKFVYALLQTSLSDGDATADDKLQVTFIKLGDKGDFEAVELDAGKYFVQVNKVYTLASLADAGLLSAILKKDIGTYSLDELYPTATVTHGHFQIKVDKYTELKDGIIIYDISGKKWTDVDGAEISGIKDETGSLIIKDSDIGTLASGLGISAELNGIGVPKNLVDITAKDKIELNISDNSGNEIYEDTVISLSW